MVKSKKLSRGSLAVLLLALLLALSMVVGITGAWFTDSAKNGNQTEPISFGKVAVSVGATSVSATGAVDIAHMVDHDKVTITVGEVKNESTVAIKYILGFSFTVENNTVKDKEGHDVSDATLLGWFGLAKLDEAEVEIKDMAAAGTISTADLTAKAGDHVLDSNNAANGCTGSFTLKVTLKIAAIQAQHYEEAKQTGEANTAEAELCAMYAALQ